MLLVDLLVVCVDRTVFLTTFSRLYCSSEPTLAEVTHLGDYVLGVHRAVVLVHNCIPADCVWCYSGRVEILLALWPILGWFNIPATLKSLKYFKNSISYSYGIIIYSYLQDLQHVTSQVFEFNVPRIEFKLMRGR